LKRAADKVKDEILPRDAHLATRPAGYLGVKHPPMFPIPDHLWGSPILHDELGLVKDWLTRAKRFSDSRIENLPEDEVALGNI
jgi:hypothetical protein